jgi:phosphohistidine phosphatase SixA
MKLRAAFACLLLVSSVAAAPLTAQTAASAPAVAPAPPKPVVEMENRKLSSTELSARLLKGGLVILMRHERTEVPSNGDDYSKPASDCTAQRNLSVAGVAGSAETGVAIRALGWPIGKVLVSPMCRSMETARFMFGRYEVEPRLMHHDNRPERNVTVSGRELNDLLATIPRGGSDNTVMVSHIGNIYFAIALTLSEGEFGVLERQENGSYVILGTIDPGVIGALARQAQYMAAQAKKPDAK